MSKFGGIQVEDDEQPRSKFGGVPVVDAAPQEPKSLARQVGETVLSPGVGALEAVASAPGIPVSAFGLVGEGLNWLTGREWKPGQSPWQSGWTAADWLEKARQPVAKPEDRINLPMGLMKPAEESVNFLTGRGGLGLNTPREPANEIDRVGRKAGGLIMMGGPAGAAPALTATGTSEVGRALDKAGVTGGYGETVGLLAGPLVHEAGRAAARAAIPRVDPEVARQANELMQRGVRVAPSQIAEGQTLGYTRSGADAATVFPSSFTRRQGEEFTRAVSHSFGENTPRISQNVIDQAERRIAGELGQRYASATIDATRSPNLVNDLARIETTAQRVLAPQQFDYVSRALNEAVDVVGQGQVPGVQFWNMIKYNARSALNNTMRNQDPMVSRFGSDIREVLMRALEDGAPAGLRNELRTFNRQYQNLATVRDLALRGGGKVSPQALLGAVVREQGGVRGELGTLAEAGKSVLSPLPNSGTAQRATAIAALTGGPILAGQPWLIPYALSAPPIARGLLDSQTLTRAMIARALPQAQPAGLLGPIGQTAARAAPGQVGLLGRQYLAPQHFSGAGLLHP